MTKKQNDDLKDFKKVDKSINSEGENRVKFKDFIKHFKFIGNKKLSTMVV